MGRKESNQSKQTKQSSGTEVHNYLEISTCDPLKYIMDNPILIVFMGMVKSIRIQRVKHHLNILFSEMPKHHTFFAALSALVFKVWIKR